MPHLAVHLRGGNQLGNGSPSSSSSLELFAREVMPEFHERDGEHLEWKRGVLSGEIELPEIDTQPYNVRTNQTPTKTAAG